MRNITPALQIKNTMKAPSITNQSTPSSVRGFVGQFPSFKAAMRTTKRPRIGEKFQTEATVKMNPNPSI